jgi:hypothetical protein
VSDPTFAKPKEQLNLTQITARDRRMAAIHEAGHMVIAGRFGVRYQAWILPAPDNDPWEEKTWIGTCRFLGEKKPTKQQKRMIAVAGAAAEACWQDREMWDGAEDINWYDPAVMSPSDWRGAGCPVGKPDTHFFTAVGDVAALLRPDGGPLWSPLIQAARNLIAESRTIRYSHTDTSV